MLWKRLPGTVENATGANEQRLTVLGASQAHIWERHCGIVKKNEESGSERKHGPIFDLLFSLEMYRSWNLVKAYFAGLSKTQTSKINLFFSTALLPTHTVLFKDLYLPTFNMNTLKRACERRAERKSTLNK